MRKWLMVLAAMAACGGGEKAAEEPVEPVADVESDEGDDSGDEGMIPAEKFDEIKRTFERKQTQVSRCFVAGVDAGEIQKTDKGAVTIGATITKAGKASNIRVIETTFKSPAMEQCIKDKVAGWVFTTLPQELDYSYQYRLERF